MRVEQSFVVDRSPKVVFAYVTDPENLAAWQTSKTRVEQLTEGPPGLGMRVREWTRGPGGREFEQVVEFTVFEPPNHVHIHIVEGPFPIDAVYRFEPSGDGTLVHFNTEGRMRGPARLFEPLGARMIARRMREYHENLRRNVEAD